MLLYLVLLLAISTTLSTQLDADPMLQPRFDQSDETVSVVVGKRALLPCYISLPETKHPALDPFKVIWMKLNNSSILTMEERAINGDPRISVVHAYAEEWNLQIEDIDEDDAGIYRCFINTGRHKTVTLEVKVPPKIIDDLTTKPYPSSIRSGSNLTIRCYAQGKPTPSIRILSYDQADNAKTISEENEVTLYNISRHTNRRYECIASNGYPPDVARSFQFVIQYPPEITLFVNEQIAPKSLFTKNYQQEIHLKCQVLMNPSEKILWMKDERPISNHYQVYEIGNYIISELIVQLLTDADQGAYSCVASNSLGSDSQSVHLSTLSRPTTTTKRVTARRKRPKYFRITSPESSLFYSTESSRMMTISSAAIKYTSSRNFVGLCLSVTVVFFR